MDEEKRKLEKPLLSKEEAMLICFEKFSIEVEKIKALDSYDDANFYVEGKNADGVFGRYVLKIHNGVESENLSFLQGSNAMLRYLANQESTTIRAPFPMSTYGRSEECIAWKMLRRKSTTGKDTDHGKKRVFAIRLLRYVDGMLMNEISPVTPKGIRNLGAFLGRLRTQLDRFTTTSTKVNLDGFVREHLWDVRRTADLETFVSAIDDSERRRLVDDVIREFKSTALAIDEQLPLAVLHNDFNDANVIVQKNSKQKLIMNGVIDFGDSVMSWRANDIGIAIAYLLVMLHRSDRPMQMSGFRASRKDIKAISMEAVSLFMQGVDSEYTLTARERALVPVLAACRLAISGTMGLYSYSLDPTNEYLKEHARPAWDALFTIRASKSQLISALGLEKVSNTEEATHSTSSASDGAHTEAYDIDVNEGERTVRVTREGSVDITGGLRGVVMVTSSSKESIDDDVASEVVETAHATRKKAADLAKIYRTKNLSARQIERVCDLFHKWDAESHGYLLVSEFHDRLVESDVGSIQGNAFLVLMGYDDYKSVGSDERIDLPNVLKFFDDWHGGDDEWEGSKSNPDAVFDQMIQECYDLHMRRTTLARAMSPIDEEMTPDAVANLF